MPPSEFSLESLERRMPAPVARALAALPTGRSADGFLHVVTPDVLDDTLARWLGGFDPSRTPFARTALGDLIYVRDLRELAREIGMDPDAAEVEHDVSLINVRFRRAKVLTTSFDEFVTNLTDPAWLASELDKDLYDEVVERLGRPTFDEVYAFVPALGLRG